MNPVAFSLFGLDIYWYGLTYAIGLILGSLLVKHYIKKYNEINLPLEYCDDLLSFIAVGIILGGRLGCFVFYEATIFTMDIFMIRNGGMSFHGAILGCLFCIWFFSNKYKQNFLEVADLVCLVAPIGLFLGRIANYINDDMPGRFMFGIQHPVVLYEAVFEGIILFMILNYLYPKFLEKKGLISAIFLICYSFFRFFLDFLKDQPNICFCLNMGQILCLLMFLIGIILLKKLIK